MSAPLDGIRRPAVDHAGRTAQRKCSLPNLRRLNDQGRPNPEPDHRISPPSRQIGKPSAHVLALRLASQLPRGIRHLPRSPLRGAVAQSPVSCARTTPSCTTFLRNIVLYHFPLLLALRSRPPTCGAAPPPTPKELVPAFSPLTAFAQNARRPVLAVVKFSWCVPLTNIIPLGLIWRMRTQRPFQLRPVRSEMPRRPALAKRVFAYMGNLAPCAASLPGPSPVSPRFRMARRKKIYDGRRIFSYDGPRADTLSVFQGLTRHGQKPREAHCMMRAQGVLNNLPEANFFFQRPRAVGIPSRISFATRFSNCSQQLLSGSVKSSVDSSCQHSPRLPCRSGSDG